MQLNCTIQTDNLSSETSTVYLVFLRFCVRRICGTMRQSPAERGGCSGCYSEVVKYYGTPNDVRKSDK